MRQLSKLTVALFFVHYPVAQAADDAPNIVLLMADDLGWGDVGFNGNQTIRTPHLDAMAGNGLKMSRFYAAAPVCSPTRGACLTGRHPYRYGIVSANAGHLRAPEVTLAEMLRSKGYRSGHFGKWHLGTLSKTYSGKGSKRKPAKNFMTPGQNGFDEWFSTEFAVATWDPYDPAHSHVKGRNAGDPRNCYWHNGVNIRDGLTGDDSRIIMDKAVPFVRESVRSGKPFFAVVWFHAPHKPVVAGPKYRAMYADQPEGAQHYYGCITAMDEQIGRLRSELRALKVAEDTIVCFCSDNGPEGRQRGRGTEWGSAGPFRGRKRSLHEGGIRVPGLVEWPARIAAGRVTDFPAVTSDYLPTILEICNLTTDARPRDGISLVDLWAGKETPRVRPIGFQSGRQRAWIADRFKLISTDTGKTWQLYDLKADPGEARDLADEKPDRVHSMREQLKSWRQSCQRSRDGADYANVKGAGETR